MNTEDFYYKLKHEPKSLYQVNEYAKTARWSWVPFMNVARSFQNTLGSKIIQQNELLTKLQSKFDAKMRLYMFPSMTCYNWHRDAEIGCSMNLVLDDYSAHTLFNPANRKDILDKVIELKYEKNKWYLFNSQILHTVINLDTRDRPLLTLSFPLGVDYQTVLKFIKSEENLT